MENNIYKELFLKSMDSIIDDDIKSFAKILADNIPDYFYIVPASSSGKYHPIADLGDGGLVRHSISVLKILDTIMTPEQCDFTPKQKDLLRVAALFHDSFKSGTQEMFENSTNTKFQHPLYAVEFIRTYANECDKIGLVKEDVEFIVSAVASHMGQWNESKYEPGIYLPKPQTKFQQVLHLADYIASRKFINIDLSDLN